MDNSEQKNSIEEEDTKYVKTPELNMGERYSHRGSGDNISARSTEKESKKTTRYHSSQKLKSIKVAKEIQECKKDLMKMQKINEMRKKKVEEETEQNKDIERRKQNLETLNEMLRKRNKHFKKKKRNQEKSLKKDMVNFEKSTGISFYKRSNKKKLNFKNMKRNQTFSCLSSKGPCDTMNTSKHELGTEEKSNKNMLELKVSIKKDKANKIESSTTMMHSPASKPCFSSHKKKSKCISNTKRKSGKKKINYSLKADSSHKIKSVSKLSNKNSGNVNFANPKRGYTNAYKKKKAIQSETKRMDGGATNQFNDISEIQEFNITDEESLITSSILKNIDEHESIQHPEGVCRETLQKMKPTLNKKSVQSTIKKPKKTNKKVKKMKFISSAKKSTKKRKKSQGESKRDTEKKSSKKRKVIFHISKQKDQEYQPSEDEYNHEQVREEEQLPTPGNKQGQIKKVEFVEPNEQLDESKEETTEEIIDLEDHQSPDPHTASCMSKDPKEYDKIDIINSAKLSELLSSKKKHRYKHIPDSMDEIMEENVGQQINFDQEADSREYQEYNSQEDSRVSHPQETLEHEGKEITQKSDSSNNSDIESCRQLEEEEKSTLEQKESLPTLNRGQDSPIEQYDDARNNLYDETEAKPEQHMVIESMTYAQQQKEQNDLITESAGDEEQTVIN